MKSDFLTPNTIIRGDARVKVEQLEDLKAQAKLWVSKSRSAVKRETQLLLNKLDSAQIELAGIDAKLEHSRQSILALQDNRQTLLLAVGQMVPKAELQQAKAQCSSLSTEAERLSLLLSQRQREIDGLTVRMQGAQTEVEKLLKLMQVKPP